MTHCGIVNASLHNGKGRPNTFLDGLFHYVPLFSHIMNGKSPCDLTIFNGKILYNVFF